METHTYTVTSPPQQSSPASCFDQLTATYIVVMNFEHLAKRNKVTFLASIREKRRGAIELSTGSYTSVVLPVGWGGDVLYKGWAMDHHPQQAGLKRPSWLNLRKKVAIMYSLVCKCITYTLYQSTYIRLTQRCNAKYICYSLRFVNSQLYSWPLCNSIFWEVSVTLCSA